MSLYQQTLFRSLNASYKPTKMIVGQLYLKPEDFHVYELDGKGVCVCDKKPSRNSNNKVRAFLEYTLIKKGISTFEAAIQLAKFLGIDSNQINYCGLKDTFGLTTQEITVPGNINAEYLKSKKFQNFSLVNPRYVDKPKKLRQIKGNRFKIVVRSVLNNRGEIQKILPDFKKFISNSKLPNFYGHQRFGVRQNNHLIGKEIIKGNYERAAKIFLTNSKNEPNEITEIRNLLKKHWGMWETSLLLVKQRKELIQEEKVIFYLLKHPGCYLEALNETPFLMFFINSFNSYLFNRVLKRLIEERHPNQISMPLLGYKTRFNHPQIKREYSLILREEGITLGMYKNKGMPSISYAGRNRAAFYRVNRFSYSIDNKKITIFFDLPGGVYANLFLDLFVRNTSKMSKLN